MSFSRRRYGGAGTILALAALLGWVFSGCTGSPPADAPAGKKVTVQAADAAELARVLDKHRGKVVLVDFWATWCPPCLELFPHTVQLHRRLADRGLVVISVSLDNPDEQPAVLKTLGAKGAAFENFISRNDSGGRFYDAFAITGGSLPHLKLYDRHGKLHQTFASDKQTIDPRQIDRAVEELLGL